MRYSSWQGNQPTAMGYLYKGEYWWQDAPLYLKSVDLAPETREQARWFNKIYNEGLLDPEMFIMKNDQFYAKVGERRVRRDPLVLGAHRQRGAGRARAGLRLAGDPVLLSRSTCRA